MKKLSYEEIINQSLEQFSCDHGWNCTNCGDEICVKIVSVADFPSEYGDFQIIGFIFNEEGESDHCAVIKGDLQDGENVLVRIHSECLTGDALGSKRCDCGPQLRLALKKIEQEGRGVLVYVRQEGRGIGLTNKLRAYALQDMGYDTYEANVELGFQPEERNYEIAAEMLKAVGVKSVRLMTNNPEKVEQLEKYGIKVNELLHHEISPHKDDLKYLKTKKEKFHHDLDLI